MTRACQLALGLALAVLTATTAPGQEKKRGGFRGAGGFGGGQIGLLSQKSVQEELKLSEEQIEKVTSLSKKSREGLKDLKDLSAEDRRKKLVETTAANAKALGEILKKDQSKRLKEISLQTRGGSALADPEVASALKLSDEQKDKIKTIREETRGKGRGGVSPEARKAAQEKLLGVLSDEQKTAWKTMTGEPFKGEIQIRKGKGRKKSDASPRKKNVLEVSFLAQDGEKEKKPAAKDKKKGKGPKGFGKGPWGPGKGPWAGWGKGSGKRPSAKAGKGSKRFAWSGKKGGRHMAFGPRHHRGHRGLMGRHAGHRHGWAGRSGRSMGSRNARHSHHRHGWAGRGHGKRSPSARGWGGHRHGPRAGWSGRGHGRDMPRFGSRGRSRPGSSAFSRGPSRPPMGASRFGGSRGRSGGGSSDIRGELERIDRMLAELQRKLRR